MHYTLEEIREKQRRYLKEAVKEIFQISRSRKKTTEILEKLGISRGKIHDVLNQLGLRESVDWTEVIEVGGIAIKLEDLAILFMARKYLTIKEKYLAFTTYLKDEGIDKTIFFGSYEGVRKKILKSRS
ncbi:MAG: hypothetical protein HYU80_03240 [Candidatus Blackburnbacteria bacterium]|nr:hypothetical protein [Candidatus Blackburnbacteria bacterium]